MEKIKDLWSNAKDLFENNRRAFCQILTKASFALLYFINLFIPFYFIVIFATKNRVNIILFRETWFYLIIFIAAIVLYLYNALGKKPMLANKIFKIYTILSFVMFVRFFIGFSVDNGNFTTVGLSLGFFFQIILIVGMVLLTWKEKFIMGYIYKIFKVPDIKEVEYVKEPTAEPVEVVEPETEKKE